jgi:hypothetical protein
LWKGKREWKPSSSGSENKKEEGDGDGEDDDDEEEEDHLFILYSHSIIKYKAHNKTIGYRIGPGKKKFP